ncbi:MAG TPA: hypothetical protein VE781_16960 [Kineosporiaceae bacterium]|jgi:hypothetical protein|nr:hypothetical protein [Kineosporiaceae bacterium]
MPRPAVRGIGIGLLLMAVFTLFWSSLVTAGWPDARGWAAFALFAAAALATGGAVVLTVWAATGPGAALGTSPYGVHVARQARLVLARR